MKVDWKVFAATVGLMGAGWAYDVRVGRYWRKRARKLGMIAVMLHDTLERNDVGLDDFTWIAINEIIDKERPIRKD